ncbi:MAG: DUF2268 domain-containing putative Zn-dependent protease [Flavobacteriaceae bacterium]
MKNHYPIFRALCILFLAMILQGCKNSKEPKDSIPECSSPCTEEGYVFCYEDIANFRETYKIMEQGGDTIAAFEDYFKKASAGLKGWISRYNWTPEKLAKRIALQPKYYASLLHIDEDLKKLEADISKHYDGMKALYPSEFVTIPPTYYFIMWGGGGSIELTGNMISIDYFGYKEGLDQTEFEQYGGLFPKGTFPIVGLEDVPQIAVHEVAHLFQTYLQGELDYVSMYLEEDKTTMLAYAIREGGAEFIAYLGTGLTDPKKHHYGDQHEQELWEEFKPLMTEHPDKHKGWFSGKSDKNPDWPWQIGYYMGFKMTQAYYDRSEDKEKALLTIMTAKDVATYQEIADTYNAKFE